jgi:hypothetical protein
MLRCRRGDPLAVGEVGDLRVGRERGHDDLQRQPTGPGRARDARRLACRKRSWHTIVTGRRPAVIVRKQHSPASSLRLTGSAQWVTTPDSQARIAGCVRPRAPSLVKIRLTCVLAVGADQRGESGARQRLVIDDEHLDQLATPSTRTSAVTRKPPPATGPNARNLRNLVWSVLGFRRWSGSFAVGRTPPAGQADAARP